MNQQHNNKYKQTTTINMLNKSLVLPMLLLVLFVTAEAAVQMKSKYDENDVFVKDLKLFTGSTQYFIKGVNYSPQPLGRPYKGGLCSQKINYEGVFYDACIDEDYFDGSQNNNGYAAKPDVHGSKLCGTEIYLQSKNLELILFVFITWDLSHRN
jgi:hypothetical protein